MCDRVAWDYMGAVLEALGIGQRMCFFILSLYANPRARVRVNGHLSNAFTIHNGTRQGCPLSPLLYILTLEPLLRCIWANSDIKGIKVHNREFKMAAFADDILLILSSPLTSLQNLLSVLEQFKSLSNLKINYAKSFAPNVSLPTNLAMHCQENSPFKWKADYITYLGIQLPVRL